MSDIEPTHDSAGVPESIVSDSSDGPVIKLSASHRRSLVLNGIFILLAVYMLQFASAVLIPITVAILLFLLLSRPVQSLGKLGIPPAACAILGVAVVAGVLVGSVTSLAGPAQNWIENIPKSFYKVEQKLNQFKQPFEKTEEALRKVEKATEIKPEPDVQKVEIERPSYLDDLFSGTPQLLASIGSTLMLLLFLVSSGDTFVRKLVSFNSTLTDKKNTVEITRNIQDDISFYLLTVTLLNITTGILTAMYCFWVGVDDPLLWGSLASLFGFVPFVGPVLMTAILGFVGMLEFDSLLLAMSIPLAYIAVVFVCNSVLLPLVLGRRLTLNPVAIFLAIMFWGWAWGIVGILLAVPILACAKIICERIEPLQPFAEFLTP